MDRRQQGNAAETRALEYLLDHGLTLVCRNFFCKMGELDLVMLDKRTPAATLAVVEVRSREDRGYGTAVESITRTKIKRIVRATGYLLLKQPEFRRLPIRFDVVTLDKTRGGVEKIEWIRGAFDAGR